MSISPFIDIRNVQISPFVEYQIMLKSPVRDLPKYVRIPVHRYPKCVDIPVRRVSNHVEIPVRDLPKYVRIPVHRFLPAMDFPFLPMISLMIPPFFSLKISAGLAGPADGKTQRYFPVLLSGIAAMSAGVPVPTILPPSSPPPGPISMM